jgi:hypothetical protein
MPVPTRATGKDPPWAEYSRGLTQYFSSIPRPGELEPESDEEGGVAEALDHPRLADDPIGRCPRSCRRGRSGRAAARRADVHGHGEPRERALSAIAAPRAMASSFEKRGEAELGLLGLDFGDQRLELRSFHHLPPIIAATSALAPAMPIIPNFSTRMEATPGERKPGRVGPSRDLLEAEGEEGQEDEDGLLLVPGYIEGEGQVVHVREAEDSLSFSAMRASCRSRCTAPRRARRGMPPMSPRPSLL